MQSVSLLLLLLLLPLVLTQEAAMDEKTKEQYQILQNLEDLNKKID